MHIIACYPEEKRLSNLQTSRTIAGSFQVKHSGVVMNADK